MKFRLFIFLYLFCVAIQSQEKEDERLLTQLSSFLSKSYYSINLGGIFYNYGNHNLPEDYSSSSVSRNFFSGRLLLGHKLNENLAVQFGVMRPAAWFKYDNINNIGYFRSVWVNVWSLSLKKNFTIDDKWSLYGELGWANVARVGFSIDDTEIYSDAHFGEIITAFGLQYKLSDKWRLSLNGTYIPKSDTHNQPAISQASLGFEYHLQQKSKEKALKQAANPYFFPRNIIQISYGNGGIGYGVNRFFGMSTKVGNFESFGIPIFWVGDVKAQHSFSITYQRTAYRSRKLFSLDWGASITGFQSELGKTNVFAFSVFPVLRFYLWRNNTFDLYTNYSIIGPTYLTKSDIDGFISGPKITYQDTMGLGVFLGKTRKYNFELRIMHYSNGNIFNRNAGVAVPIQFTLGKTF